MVYKIYYFIYLIISHTARFYEINEYDDDNSGDKKDRKASFHFNICITLSRCFLLFFFVWFNFEFQFPSFLATLKERSNNVTNNFVWLVFLLCILYFFSSLFVRFLLFIQLTNSFPIVVIYFREKNKTITHVCVYIYIWMNDTLTTQLKI